MIFRTICVSLVAAALLVPSVGCKDKTAYAPQAVTPPPMLPPAKAVKAHSRKKPAEVAKPTVATEADQ